MTMEERKCKDGRNYVDGRMSLNELITHVKGGIELHDDSMYRNTNRLNQSQQVRVTVTFKSPAL